nr:ABC transporter substrate-binding protein [Alteromonas sp. 5E99-2]
MEINNLVNRFLAAVFTVTLSLSALAQEKNENPYETVQHVAEKTFARIKNEKPEIDADPEVLRTIMEQELLPHIDYQFAAFKVLGKHFRSVPKEKLSEYVQVFRKYLITTYAGAMSYYDDQEVVFEPASDIEDKKAVTVRAVIKDNARPDIKIAFKVRKNSKTNQWKAYDMVAEGISLIDSKRSEFESILRKGGIDEVIGIMNERIEKPLELDNGEDESASGE